MCLVCSRISFIRYLIFQFCILVLAVFFAWNFLPYFFTSYLSLTLCTTPNTCLPTPQIQQSHKGWKQLLNNCTHSSITSQVVRRGPRHSTKSQSSQAQTTDQKMDPEIKRELDDPLSTDFLQEGLVDRGGEIGIYSDKPFVVLGTEELINFKNKQIQSTIFSPLPFQYQTP